MKKFRDLLIAGIDEDIHGTTIERLIKVKQTFESEMIYNNIKPSPELIMLWLQGLPWAVYVPYENNAIIDWYEKVLKRSIKEPKGVKGQSEREKLLEKFWPQCGRTLYEMLYK